jgi:ankyrin repeat protein
VHQDVNPNSRNTYGETPLWIAACYGHRNVVELLLQKNDVDVNSKSNAGRAPIFWPSASGNEGIVRLLMGAGADPGFQDEDGETAISIARKHGHEAIVEMLEQAGRCLKGNAS